MFLNENEKETLLLGVRCFIYLALIMCFICFINYLASIYKATTFAENGVVENIQLGLLLTAGISFFIQAIYSKTWRPLMLFLASLCFLASCRELDKTLDELIYGLRWRIGFVFPLIAGGIRFEISGDISSEFICIFGLINILFAVLCSHYHFPDCAMHRSSSARGKCFGRE